MHYGNRHTAYIQQVDEDYLDMDMDMDKDMDIDKHLDMDNGHRLLLDWLMLSLKWKQ
jgi:hypothetical protein